MMQEVYIKNQLTLDSCYTINPRGSNVLIILTSTLIGNIVSLEFIKPQVSWLIKLA